MQDSFGILHVNGTFGAIHTRNHVIRCHTAAFTAVCMQVAFCNLHEKVENRLLHQNHVSVSRRTDNLATTLFLRPVHGQIGFFHNFVDRFA